MGWPERAVFQATRLLLATRTSRNLFAAYCIALHVLVLFMLFSGGSSTHIVPSGPPSIKDFVPDVGGAADDGAPTWDEEIHS
jgi:homeobox protein cut-like